MVDFAKAVSYKAAQHLWQDHSLCSSYEQVLEEHKSAYLFGTWEELFFPNKTPPARHFASYCHDNNGKFFVFGGEDAALPPEQVRLGPNAKKVQAEYGIDLASIQGKERSDLWVLDTAAEPSKWFWSLVELGQGSVALPPLQKAGMCCFNGIVYMYGGMRDFIYQPDIFAVELSSGQCRKLRTKGGSPEPRPAMSFFQYKGSLMLWGGHETDTDLWQLDLSSASGTNRTLKWQKRRV